MDRSILRSGFINVRDDIEVERIGLRKSERNECRKRLGVRLERSVGRWLDMVGSLLSFFRKEGKPW